MDEKELLMEELSRILKAMQGLSPGNDKYEALVKTYQILSNALNEKDKVSERNVECFVQKETDEARLEFEKQKLAFEKEKADRDILSRKELDEEKLAFEKDKLSFEKERFSFEKEKDGLDRKASEEKMIFEKNRSLEDRKSNEKRALIDLGKEGLKGVVQIGLGIFNAKMFVALLRHEETGVLTSKALQFISKGIKLG